MKFLIYTLIILFCSFNLFANEPEKPMREEVRTAMKNNLTEIKACYDKLLKTDSGASGKIVLDIEVNDEGKVVSSKVNPGKSRWMTNDGKGKEGLSLAKNKKHRSACRQKRDERIHHLSFRLWLEVIDAPSFAYYLRSLSNF